MSNDNVKISEETARAIDDFIMTYYNDGLTDDFRQLTPPQRVGVFIRCVGLRLPKFKAIDLNSNPGLSVHSLQEIIGNGLRAILEEVNAPSHYYETGTKSSATSLQ